MGFLRNWWNRVAKKEDPFAEDEEAVSDEEILDREATDFADEIQRKRYVTRCLEQMKEALFNVESLSAEYNQVTAYLTDMEEIEALPEEERERLNANARAISSLEDDREKYLRKSGRMSEEKFRLMEKNEPDIEEARKKLADAEEYQELIRKDLRRLDSEKHTYRYRRAELRAALENTKGMAVICICALAAGLLMLLILQAGFGMDTQIGYILLAAAAAVVIMLLYLRHSEAAKELERVNRLMNQLILLQNKVKIRYVNNTNLLDYLCLKYGVSGSEELEQLWEQYMKELKEREKYHQTSAELDYYQSELVKQLRRLRIKDPDIWLHQTVAIIDNKEMVEIRHGFIMRRQKLRKQMEYNKELADSARDEIKSLVSEYPQYAQEILAMVSKYDN
ncbi:MAG: hypothetical protein GX234_02585 [Clostridiales bacterium]|nr:hypothetical protein [Clostridiales bacterium]